MLYYGRILAKNEIKSGRKAIFVKNKDYRFFPDANFL